MDLKSKAVNGAIWVTVEKFVGQFVSFIFGLILARILSPSDYGIVGMLAIFLGVASTFTDSGMGSALIQKQNRTDKDFSTVFWFNLFVSTFFYVLLYFAAPYIAQFYNIPLLASVTRVISISLIINAFSTIHKTKLTIEMRFREQSVITIICTLLTCLLGLLFAYLGYGVWALVLQTLSTASLTAILTMGVTRWVPKLLFCKESFKQLFGYGSRILGSSLINTIYQNIYTIVIGKVFAPAQVGYYNRALQFANLPAQTVQDMSLKVNFPILATIQDDNKGLLNAYRKLITVPMYLLYPLLIGLATTAEPLIQILIGEKWLPCVPMLQILCIGCMFGPLTHTNLNLLYVKGRTDLVLKLEVIKKPLGFLILFCTIPFGITWMIVGKVFYDFIAFSFNCYYTGKLLGYGELMQLKELLPIFSKAIAMGGIVFCVMQFLTNPLLKILVAVITGVSSYVILSIIFKDSCWSELIQIIKRLIKKK